MRIFACSDHHFFHKNIIKYAQRPFNLNSSTCVSDCAEFMVKMHNAVVREDDLVMFVGDLSASLRGQEQELKDYLNRMNGTKVLIRGNHDHLKDDFYKDCGFVKIVDYFKIGDYFICHYPCYESKWNKKKEPNMIRALKNSKCTKIIHGHIHNKSPKNWEPDGYSRTNVCVDFTPNMFQPVLMSDSVFLEFFKYYK